MGSVEAFVAEVVDAGPRMRRVIFDVPHLDQLTMPGAGDEAVGVYVPDDDEGRNYTVRHRGPGANQLTCDFVLHERGVASGWARRAAAGDRVVLDQARSGYRAATTS